MTLIISDSDKFYEDNNGIKKKKLEIEKKKKTAQTWVTDGLFKEGIFETCTRRSHT